MRAVEYCYTRSVALSFPAISISFFPPHSTRRVVRPARDDNAKILALRQLRRRNIISPDAIPYQTTLGATTTATSLPRTWKGYSAVMIAIMNALEPLGVRDLDMPATSERVWQAIRTTGIPTT